MRASRGRPHQFTAAAVPSKRQTHFEKVVSPGKTAVLTLFCRLDAASLSPDGVQRRGSQEESRFPHQQPHFGGRVVGLSPSACGKLPDFDGKPLTAGENSILQEG
jgi:hypothetical protein